MEGVDKSLKFYHHLVNNRFINSEAHIILQVAYFYYTFSMIIIFVFVVTLFNNIPIYQSSIYGQPSFRLNKRVQTLKA
jgi:uncharacterized membrane protein YagU involved in acid resistance